MVKGGRAPLISESRAKKPRNSKHATANKIPHELSPTYRQILKIELNRDSTTGVVDRSYVCYPKHEGQQILAEYHKKCVEYSLAAGDFKMCTAKFKFRDPKANEREEDITEGYVYIIPTDEEHVDYFSNIFGSIVLDDGSCFKAVTLASIQKTVII